MKNCELGFEKLWAGFSWVLKNYELGLAGFEKIKVSFLAGFSRFLIHIIEKVYGEFLNIKIISWVWLGLAGFNQNKK